MGLLFGREEERKRRGGEWNVVLEGKRRERGGEDRGMWADTVCSCVC